MVYVSITGLALTSPLFAPVFWWHAIRSMAQAKAALGIISADARRIEGVYHTLSVWENEAAMRVFLVSGAHRAAMRSFRNIATGKTVSYLAEAAPHWDAVHDIWVQKGVASGDKRYS
jgi:hypothetical protein